MADPKKPERLRAIEGVHAKYHGYVYVCEDADPYIEFLETKLAAFLDAYGRTVEEIAGDVLNESLIDQLKPQMVSAPMLENPVIEGNETCATCGHLFRAHNGDRCHGGAGGGGCSCPVFQAVTS